jgi:dTDP-4-dehydrorhamnose 3,5-epimerase
MKEVIVTPLNRIGVYGGDVLHGLKKTDVGFNGFGELYFSLVEKDYIKAWKRHREMTMNLIVPIGNVQFAFVRDLDSTEIYTQCIGIHNYCRLTVPPGIWFGFKGLNSQTNLVVNYSSILNDADEVDRVALDRIQYDWSA